VNRVERERSIESEAAAASRVKTERRLPVGRLAGPLLILLAAVALFVEAGRLPVVPVPGQLGPDFWPRLVLVGIVAGCLLKVVEVMRGREAPAEAAPALPISAPKLAGLIALIIGYAVLAPILGFPLTTFFFLIAFMRLGGTRRLVPALAIAGPGTIGLLYLFVKVVYLPLPKGAGVMEDLTIALYRLLRIF
jgi:hypothetical protein